MDVEDGRKGESTRDSVCGVAKSATSAKLEVRSGVEGRDEGRGRVEGDDVRRTLWTATPYILPRSHWGKVKWRDLLPGNASKSTSA